MSFPRTLFRAALATCFVMASAQLALAQSDAEIAMNEARAAFLNEDFEQARDLAAKASQTDAQNPDVFLLLGKAHLHLGELDQALAAMQSVIRLAPNHEYARRMVATLQGRLTDADVLIRLARTNLAEGFLQTARGNLTTLRSRNSLSDTQRQQVLLLLAEVSVLESKGTDALAYINELVIRNAEAKGTLPVRLLTARAQLAAGGTMTAPAVADLTAIAAESAETPEGEVAALELLLHKLDQGEDAVAEVAAWVADHDELTAARRAREALRDSVHRFLAQSPVTIGPKVNATLNDDDLAAIAAAKHAFAAFVDAEDQVALAKALVEHLEKRYTAIRAYDAVRAGLDAIDEIETSAAVDEVVAAARKKMLEAEATYEYSQIAVSIANQHADPDRLAVWIANHAGHPKELEASRTLIFSYLNVVRRQAAPAADATLSEADLKALDAAAKLLPKLKDVNEAAAITKAVAQHFREHYFDRGAYSAAIDGTSQLAAIERPTRRATLLHELVRFQQAVAMRELQEAVAAGTVPAGTAPLPESMQAVVATVERINTEFPASPAWSAQVALAGQILDQTAAVAYPTKITTPKAGHGWAMTLALPVIESATDDTSVAAARAVVDRVVNELAALTQPSAAGLAIATHEQLRSLLSPEHKHWAEVTLRHVDLLSAAAAREFQENIRSGEAAKNEALTETQQQILSLLSSVVTQQPALADPAMLKLTTHLQLWLNARHDQVVEAAYEKFAADLPPTAQRMARLALARLWLGEMMAEHRRILDSGFEAPRELDERATQVLEECYRLAASLGEGDPLAAQIAATRQQVIDHYLALDYSDIAEQAIKVKVDPANADLDERAELELAGLKRRTAEQQLAQQLRQHNGDKQIVLTPAFNEAIAALKKFITDHPTSERVPLAADGILAIGTRFEQHEAWSIAAGIYADFETFAAEVEALTQQQAGQLTYPERAAVARATALHTRASRALHEAIAAQPADADPPAAASEEFQAAQAAWVKVIGDYGTRPVAQPAIGRIMAIAEEYARVGSWDVADATYASLLALELPLRSPERLEFGRAICQLGKVLPDHARTILAALSVTGRSSRDGGRPGGENSAEELISSLAQATPTIPSLDAYDRPATATAGPGSREVPDPSDPLGPALANEPQLEGEAFADDSGKLAANDSQPQAGDAGAGAGGGFGGYYEEADRERSRSDAQLLAAVQGELRRQSSQIAMLRDEAFSYRSPAQYSQQGQGKSGEGQEQREAHETVAIAVLSDAELARQQEVLDAVYAALQAIRDQHAESPTAAQSRDEIFVIVNHWRQIGQWDRAALLARRYLADNPTDIRLPGIRQEIARDWLAWASQGVRDPELDREELLVEISSRFDTAREELQAIIDAFPDETSVRHEAQWDIANSFLTQARVVAASSPTLARGQYVRASTELLRVAELFHDHPQIGSIPNMLWGIANELTSRQYHDEAISVWNELRIHYPTHNLADQSALHIAQTWQRLGQPLRAVESYLELNFARGGNDVQLQNTIYQIAVSLKTEKRWIESLHVLLTFVDSFPLHANAGQALTMIGQIHQENEVWDDAIAAYGRVIDEFPGGGWTMEARWSIAECTINLSLWEEAIGAYAEFQQSYPDDGRVAEAARRIDVLKTLSRYQDVIDEEGQRKAFDAQYQVAQIVHSQLSNPVKAVIEYRKVAKNWPQSHLADDALFEIGKIYMNRGETESARTALLEAASRYPASPLADDALLLVGQSYVAEADQLSAVNRSSSQARAKDIVQKQAYRYARDNRRRQVERNIDQVAELRAKGESEEAANKEAYFAGQALQFEAANTLNLSNWASQQEEVLSAAQLADRQDKINAALRNAVASFRDAASVTSADKADDALLQMAQIYDERLKDSEAAMSTWEEIVKQYSGTAVAEDASWKIASYYESASEHQKAIDAYQTFFRNYRRSPRAGEAQALIAENYEHLGQWVQAMDAYTNYLNNFPEGPLVKKARDQINWIKTYRL